MKFVALRSNIREAISTVERATGENTSLPILKNILIKAENNKIMFSATNLEIAVMHQVSGKVIEDGVLTIPLGLFLGIVGNIQSDRLNFETKGNNLEVKTDNYNAMIQGVPADDFPITPKIKNTTNYLEIKSSLLREAIQQAVVASQPSDLRPELNTILFHFSLENLKLAATDGFRLGEKTLGASFFSGTLKEPFKALIPLSTAQEVARVACNDESVQMFLDDNQVLFRTSTTELVSRLTEGSFPDYSKIIPTEFSTEAVVNREEFLNAIKLAGVFGQKNSEVKISVHPAKKAVEISSADQSLGENTYLLPAKIKGDACDAFYNWKYLSDPMKVIKTEDISIGFQEETNPTLIKPTNDATYFYILKPILKS